MSAPERVEAKVCAQCGEDFRRPKGVGYKAFAARRFCSQHCAGVATRPRLTHCRSGEHEMVGDNVRDTPRGRSCRACEQRSELRRRPPKGPAAPRAVRKPAPKRAPVREIPAAPVRVRTKAEQWPDWRGAPGWPLEPGGRWVA